MQRALSVWFPAFPIDLLRRRDRRRGGPPERGAVLLVTPVAQREIVVLGCGLAGRAGVAPGTTVAQARALLPGGPVRLAPYEPERDRAALRALAVWAHRFSPIVAVDEPDGLLLDIGGCERVFGGESRLIAGLAGELERLGLQNRIAAGPTYGCARAVARCGPDRSVIGAGEAMAALAPLPVRALRLEPAAESAMIELGIERIGQLAAMPRSALPSRFGPAVLLALDRALGGSIETINPVRDAGVLRAVLEFDGATTRYESVRLAGRDVLRSLCEQLDDRGVGARLVELTLTRAHAEPVVLALQLSTPCREAAHLWALVSPKLERANLGTGVEAMTATARRVARLPVHQPSDWGEPAGLDAAAARAGTARLLDTLAGRLGPSAIRTASLVGSHTPERAFCLVPFDAPAAGVSQPPERPPDRPTVLFDPPEPVRVMALTPDGPVLSVEWRGSTRRIAASSGPERLAGEWWRSHSVERDYFRVQGCDGLWLWLYREAVSARWLVHGVWA